MFDEKMRGVWIGQQAIVALTSKLLLAFFKTGSGRALSLCRHSEKGLLSVTDATQTNEGFSFAVNMVTASGTVASSPQGGNLLAAHQGDSVAVAGEGEDAELVYTLFDGESYHCRLAEKIRVAEGDKEDCGELSVSQKLERWSLGSGLKYDEHELQAGVTTRRYSACYNTDVAAGVHYCRVGCNGYTDKGYALLPVYAIQTKKLTIADDLPAHSGRYVPDEACFVENACAFPSDGGWYWSLKESGCDRVVLCGCNGEEYVFQSGGERYEYFE